MARHEWSYRAVWKNAHPGRTDERVNYANSVANRFAIRRRQNEAAARNRVPSNHARTPIRSLLKARTTALGRLVNLARRFINRFQLKGA